MQEQLHITLPEKKESKKNIAINKLKTLIQSNALSEGDKLPSERDLALQLGVSRNILREALTSLSAEGMIEIRERQGIFIRSLNDLGMAYSIRGLQMLPTDFISYQLEVRTIIAVPAARLAATRRTDDDIRKLHTCYQSFAECPYSTTEELVQSGKWEALLHDLVTEAAHNPILSRVNESISMLVERNNAILHPYLLNQEGWMKHILKQHAEIIAAIEARDPKTAGDTLLVHMKDSAKRMMDLHPGIISQIFSPYLHQDPDFFKF